MNLVALERVPGKHYFIPFPGLGNPSSETSCALGRRIESSDLEQESPAIPSGVDDESSAGRNPPRSTNGMAPRRAFEFPISRIRKSFALYPGPIRAYGCRLCDSRPA